MTALDQSEFIQQNPQFYTTYMLTVSFIFTVKQKMEYDLHISSKFRLGFYVKLYSPRQFGARSTK